MANRIKVQNIKMTTTKKSEPPEPEPEILHTDRPQHSSLSSQLLAPAFPPVPTSSHFEPISCCLPAMVAGAVAVGRGS